VRWANLIYLDKTNVEMSRGWWRWANLLRSDKTNSRVFRGYAIGRNLNILGMTFVNFVVVVGGWGSARNP